MMYWLEPIGFSISERLTTHQTFLSDDMSSTQILRQNIPRLLYYPSYSTNLYIQHLKLTYTKQIGTRDQLTHRQQKRHLAHNRHPRHHVTTSPPPYLFPEIPATPEMSMSSNSQLNRVGSIEPGAKGLNTDTKISIEFARPQLPGISVT
jgi:hypothetical protein